MFTIRKRHVLLSAVAAGAVSALTASTAFAAVEWTVTESPDIGAGYSFEAMDVVTDEDAWAVGSSTADGGTATVAAHWDGSAWTHTKTPQGWDLLDVSAAANADVWAVGRGEDGGVTAHWDGRAWKDTESPKPELPDGQVPGLYTVDMIASGEAWAGGCGDGDSGSTAFTQQWDGDNWTAMELPVPDGADNSCVFSIDFVAEDNVRVYGTTWDKKAWILHWNGHEWTTEKTPDDTESVTITDSYLNRTGELCASGYTLNENLKPSPYLLCRDGETWTEVKTPDMDAFIGAIGSDGDGGVYLAGRSFDDKPVLLHYDGDAVTEETAPTGEGGGLTAVASAPGSTRTWVAGTAGDKGLAAYTG